MKILILAPFPFGKAPSQRFRYEQYLPHLKQQGHHFKIMSFFNEKTWEVLFWPGNRWRKIMGFIKGFLRRFLILFAVHRFDWILIHRETAPLGPPLMEWFIAKVFQKKIIYDFDDAIWINASSKKYLSQRFKYPQKVKKICHWSYRVSTGNQYLKDFALQFNQNSVYNPTTIDTENHHNQLKNQNSDKLVIGWTGSHSTLRYLEPLLPILEKLENKYAFEFHLICSIEPTFKLNSLIFKKWQKSTEIEDLLQFNLGLMPLTNDGWSRGKCGFKALQYMALGIPPLVSPVGVNTQIVDHGITGYVCKSNKEWFVTLESLLQNWKKRSFIGKAARQKVIEQYSVLSNQRNFLSLFRL
ncbi:glycosyltransferase [Xanthovirga aplysinae]|uniref:glycosyltransferase n=1 Tax=Xanthovirga aplysinae TaxID=2529853 RepID=UPI0012BC139A|nr:glycosyltransferase [Xanthovirga aplysinae]MTI30132.1 glycosyltransferase family 1 protein [Xanthovirga aplysinae]